MNNALRWIPEDNRAGYEDHAADLLKMAMQAQGVRAFESTKRCAAIHEAGHCVVDTITAGKVFRRPAITRIWRAPVKGLTAWIGETAPAKSAPFVHVDAREDPGEYMTFAVRILGGVVAETLFDGADYRLGSSVDEWVIAGGCARALELVGLFRTGEDALAYLMTVTSKMLTANAPTIHTIAAALERTRRLDGPALDSLLNPIVMEARP